MAGERPTGIELEVGGMQWKVTPSDELRSGRELEMTCFEDFGGTPDYPMNDITTVIKTDDGEMHIQVDRLRNQSRYTDSVTFKPGTLRAIVDHVEAAGGGQAQQRGSANGRSVFGRVLDSLSDHASYLRFRR